MKTLQDQKAIVLARKEELENKRAEIYIREQQALSQVLQSYFSGFPEDIEVEVTRGSIYFKTSHPDVKYKKELFNIYLSESWDFKDGTKPFDSIDLSYYTTSTKGVDKWELRRLQLLGEVAKIVYEEQQQILDNVNEVVLPFKEEFKVLYSQISEVGKELREIENEISNIKKEEIKSLLMSEGVEFSKGVEIGFKFNYSARVTKIKLIDITKSGKTGTVVFEYAHGGHSSREENINVEKIVSQVLDYSHNVKLEIA